MSNKVKIRIIQPPKTNKEEYSERLVYLCPYCASENIKFDGLDPIYTGPHEIKHTLGVIKRHGRGEGYTCKSCGAVFGASTSKLHFSWPQFLKIWGGPIILIILTVIFTQFWDVTIDEKGRSILNNWESVLATVCGTLGSIWIIVIAFISLIDD